MVSNEKVSIPLYYKKDKDPINGNETYTIIEDGKVTRQALLNQYIFAEFLNGRAGYTIDSLVEFKLLFSIIKYTNISVFNQNFKDKLSDLYDEIKSLTDNDYQSLVLYTVPMDYPGNYSVDPEFICSVSEILGADKLSTIMRLEYDVVKRTNGTPAVSTLPWCQSKYNTTSNGVYAIIPCLDIQNQHHPAFDSCCKENATFIIQRFKSSVVGAYFMSNIIDVHRSYIETLAPIIADMYQWVGNVAAVTEDPDTCSKIQATIVWLLKSRSNRMLLHITNQSTINHLMELVSFTNVVYTGDMPTMSGQEGYAFIDSQGMVQISKSPITGYAVVSRCDKAVNVIYETLKEYCIKPGGMNLIAACNYPFLDNVPSIFWNGRQYDD